MPKACPYKFNAPLFCVNYKERYLSEGGIAGVLDVDAAGEVVLGGGDCEVFLAGFE